MDETTQQQEQQESGAFSAGFAAVAGTEPPAASPAQDKPAAEDAAVEQPAADGATTTEKPAAEQPTAEELRIAGFTEAELRNILGRVPELETQLRKAHGKLGEYGAVIQELRKAPAPSVPTPERIQEIAASHPDIAAFVSQHLGAEGKQPAADPTPLPRQEQPSQDDVQMQLMDHFHEGWREKIGSQDFQLWIASQPEDVRNTFNTTDKARELNAVISKFDAWSATKVTRRAKSSERLQDALVPTGVAGRQAAEPNDEDAFRAGFRSVMAR